MASKLLVVKNVRIPKPFGFVSIISINVLEHTHTFRMPMTPLLYSESAFDLVVKFCGANLIKLCLRTVEAKFVFTMRSEFPQGYILSSLSLGRLRI